MQYAITVAHEVSDRVNMPDRLTMIATSDSISLAVSAAGDGDPVIFIHEFSGDLRSWAAQVDALKSRFRCVSFNARGYPPSEVPPSPAAYSQERAADDVIEVMNALAIDAACLVGLSMGAFAALHAAIRHPTRVRAVVAAGCGYGAKPSEHQDYFDAMNREADHAESIGMTAYAIELAESRYALPLRAKDDGAWQRFARELAEHSVRGMAMTLRGVLARRPSLWHLEAELAKLAQPVLLIIGDEDEPCVEPNLFMKRTVPDSALAVLPRTGHLPNLEEPGRFNQLIGEFLTAVADGSWDRIRQSIR
jgi:pimeloyl-ACP methyl ester carboxylesterase